MKKEVRKIPTAKMLKNVARTDLSQLKGVAVT
jgi:hypothetical protein